MKSVDYESYSDVPWYFKQWFFWLAYFLLCPVALGILVFGNVYYVKKGKVVPFGLANKIVAGVLGVFYCVKVFTVLFGS